MPPVRPSQLQLAQHCGLASRLAEQFPESSAAAESGKGIHVEIADAIERDREPDGLEARNAFAFYRSISGHGGQKFVERRLTLRDPEDDDIVITEGTADLVFEDPAGLVSLVDWKTGAQRSLPPADESLQLAAYGLAYCLASPTAKRLRLVYVVLDGQSMDVRASREFAPHEWWVLLDRIKRAAAKEPSASRGAWCADCWQRMHCPSWLLPAHEGQTALEPFTKPGGLTPENAAQAVLVVQALKDAAKLAEERLKLYARENPIELDGKRWMPSLVPGRKTADVAALERDGLAGKYVRTGEPYERWTWKVAR